MCNPHHNYIHITGYPMQHGDSLQFLWGKNLQCGLTQREHMYILAILWDSLLVSHLVCITQFNYGLWILQQNIQHFINTK